METDQFKLSKINEHNQNIINQHCSSGWDGCLLGNVDLLGICIVDTLFKFNIPILHHLGFVAPPYSPSEYPSSPFYSIAPASHCVRKSLVARGSSKVFNGYLPWCVMICLITQDQGFPLQFVITCLYMVWFEVRLSNLN